MSPSYARGAVEPCFRRMIAFVSISKYLRKIHRWQLPDHVRVKASPMTFSFGGNQYIIVAAALNILCFGL